MTMSEYALGVVSGTLLNRSRKLEIRSNEKVFWNSDLSQFITVIILWILPGS